MLLTTSPSLSPGKALGRWGGGKVGGGGGKVGGGEGESNHQGGKTSYHGFSLHIHLQSKVRAKFTQCLMSVIISGCRNGLHLHQAST